MRRWHWPAVLVLRNHVSRCSRTDKLRDSKVLCGLEKLSGQISALTGHSSSSTTVVLRTAAVGGILHLRRPQG